MNQRFFSRQVGYLGYSEIEARCQRDCARRLCDTRPADHSVCLLCVPIPGQGEAFLYGAESAEIWDRWRRGEGLKSIGGVFGKSSSSIFAHVCPTGGIRPAPRTR
jgi:hypothetical protein